MIRDAVFSEGKAQGRANGGGRRPLLKKPPRRCGPHKNFYSNKNMILGVTGNPILHSKSPVIFNSIFENLQINDSHAYTRIAANTPAEAMFLFKELGLTGMNVTAPFKAGIMEYLDEVEDAAKTIGGVNTVVREKEIIKGYNTDYLGVTGALAGRGISLEGKRCVVLGAGGAGRAAVYGLLKEKAIVILVNRTYSTAAIAAKELGCDMRDISSLQNLLKEVDILVSTLPAGVDIIQGEWLREGLVVFDANYKKSRLVEEAENRGCQTIRGEEWLLNQAIPAYGYFLGKKHPDIENITKVLWGPGGRTAFFKKAPWLEKELVIALVGFMGSGKSYIGKQLAQRMGFVFKDLDELIEKKAGQSVPEIFSKQGEGIFRRLEKEALAEVLQSEGRVVIACGGGVVLDAENRELLKNNCLVIWLYSSIETSLKRIPKGTRPLLDCADPVKEAQRILDERLFYYAQAADLVVSNEQCCLRRPENFSRKGFWTSKSFSLVEKISDEINKVFNH
ncbi:MAG: Shikimate kinase [Acidobacteriota bacterium]|nr:Shikimate kinase [Acidobacteriota bacterium]